MNGQSLPCPHCGRPISAEAAGCPHCRRRTLSDLLTMFESPDDRPLLGTNFLQIDTGDPVGASGMPLLNASGRVVGNALSRVGSSANFWLVLPSNYLVEGPDAMLPDLEMAIDRDRWEARSREANQADSAVNIPSSKYVMWLEQNDMLRETYVSPEQVDTSSCDDPSAVAGATLVPHNGVPSADRSIIVSK